MSPPTSSSCSTSSCAASLPWAQKDNITMVTKKLNGGITGLSDRISWVHRWKAALGNQQILLAA